MIALLKLAALFKFVCSQHYSVPGVPFLEIMKTEPKPNRETPFQHLSIPSQQNVRRQDNADHVKYTDHQALNNFRTEMEFVPPSVFQRGSELTNNKYYSHINMRYKNIGQHNPYYQHQNKDMASEGSAQIVKAVKLPDPSYDHHTFSSYPDLENWQKALSATSYFYPKYVDKEVRESVLSYPSRSQHFYQRSLDILPENSQQTTLNKSLQVSQHEKQVESQPKRESREMQYLKGLAEAIAQSDVLQESIRIVQASKVAIPARESQRESRQLQSSTEPPITEITVKQEQNVSVPSVTLNSDKDQLESAPSEAILTMQPLFYDPSVYSKNPASNRRQELEDDEYIKLYIPVRAKAAELFKIQTLKKSFDSLVPKAYSKDYSDSFLSGYPNQGVYFPPPTTFKPFQRPNYSNNVQLRPYDKYYIPPGGDYTKQHKHHFHPHHSMKNHLPRVKKENEKAIPKATFKNDKYDSRFLKTIPEIFNTLSSPFSPSKKDFHMKKTPGTHHKMKQAVKRPRQSKTFSEGHHLPRVFPKFGYNIDQHFTSFPSFGYFDIGVDDKL